jgi:hypothetical protein
VWRCFPWDPDARPGAPYSASYLARGQTVGRFDLHDRPPVRYLADSPEHALGETLSPFRGTTFHPAYLHQGGHRLALVQVTLASTLVRRIPDCTDPAVLAQWGIRPDDLAHHDRTRTQAIARKLHEHRGTAGLRWWSALTGAWHTTVVFTDRVRRGEVTFGTPRLLDPSDTEVERALSVLGIRTR